MADKATLREIELKRKQKYSDDDYKQLESLMYDSFSLKLKSAQVRYFIVIYLCFLTASQFVIGPSLDVCLTALQGDTEDRGVHLVERINIDFTVLNSIVPSARSLARMKVSGRLPSLHVNFSDSKYKTLMRLLDVAIPHLGDETAVSSPAPQRDVAPQRPTVGFQLSTGLFKDREYNVDDDAASFKTDVSERTMAESTITKAEVCTPSANLWNQLKHLPGRRHASAHFRAQIPGRFFAGLTIAFHSRPRRETTR